MSENLKTNADDHRTRTDDTPPQETPLERSGASDCSFSAIDLVGIGVDQKYEKLSPLVEEYVKTKNYSSEPLPYRDELRYPMDIFVGSKGELITCAIMMGVWLACRRFKRGMGYSS